MIYVNSMPWRQINVELTFFTVNARWGGGGQRTYLIRKNVSTENGDITGANVQSYLFSAKYKSILSANKFPVATECWNNVLSTSVNVIDMTVFQRYVERFKYYITHK